jgi:hypothetical protein
MKGKNMKIKTFVLPAVAIVMLFSQRVFSYPPGVGILGKAKSCMSCHVNNGPWTDDQKTIIDILDKETMKSIRQPDGTFLLDVKRNQPRTFLTVIGRTKVDDAPTPYRNAWLYIDPTRIETNSLSKFAPGWAVNLQMACRIVGDKVSGYEGATITALPMTVMPLDDAAETEIQLQVMLTKGESIKGNAKEGMAGNYFERKVALRIHE